jgi:acyl-coenzyme A thioesterase PaaI-like protein
VSSGFVREGLESLPVKEDNDCFACGPRNPYGLRMRFHTDGKAVYSWLDVPEHLGSWKNLVHGGIITTMLDEVMGQAAVCFLDAVVLTRTITVEFLKPVFLKTGIRVEGRVAEAENGKDAVTEGLLFDSEDCLRARARGVFALLAPEKARARGLVDPSPQAEPDRPRTS